MYAHVVTGSSPRAAHRRVPYPDWSSTPAPPRLLLRLGTMRLVSSSAPPTLMPRHLPPPPPPDPVPSSPLLHQEGGRRTDDGKDASSDCPRLKYFEAMQGGKSKFNLLQRGKSNFNLLAGHRYFFQLLVVSSVPLLLHLAPLCTRS